MTDYMEKYCIFDGKDHISLRKFSLEIKVHRELTLEWTLNEFRPEYNYCDVEVNTTYLDYFYHIWTVGCETVAGHWSLI